MTADLMPTVIDLDERPVLDLQYTHFEHVHRGIRVMGSWYIDPETRQSEPCLVLLDANKPMRRGRVTPCIIMQRDMWKWTVEIGDTMHVARNCQLWMASGALPGTPGNMPDVHRIFDAVQSRLRDLWSMPPMPPRAAVKHSAVPIGDLTITERGSGKTVKQLEVVSKNVRH